MRAVRFRLLGLVDNVLSFSGVPFQQNIDTSVVQW